MMKMNEQALFQQFKFFRNMTIYLAKQIKEEEADLIPKGFPNSLKWNVGHLVVSGDTLINKGILGNELQYPHLLELFNRGTKPSDWTTEPPNMDKLVQMLEEQVHHFEEAYPGKLNVPLKEPFNIGDMEISTGALYFNFAIIHESMHIGHIKSLMNAVKGLD